MADKKPLVLTNGSIKEIGAGDTVPISNGGTGATTATAALNALLPSQTGNNTKVLGTDGTNTSWVAVSGANLTGTIPSAVLGNSTHFIGTTSIALNRASANQALTGILSTTFAGSTSGTTVLIPTAIAGTTTITLPAVTGTVVTTGDSATVTNTMLAGSIANGKLANSTISGISLGSNLATLTIGTGLSGTSYNGSTAITIAIDSTVATLTGAQTLTNKTIAAGSNTISGITNTHLSGSAAISNANLANSTVTVGSTAISLGSSATTIAGLTSVTSTTFVGALTGASTSAATLTTPRTIGGVSFNGSANIVPQTIQSVNEAADTTCFPLFISASGSQSLQPLNNTAFTFNASTGALGATTLVTGGSGITVGNSVPFSDSAGTLTLQNVDVLDATTEATIEAAIDTLANLTSIQGQTFTLTGALVRSGAHSLTLTTTGTTNVTLPTTGTLATLAGTETLSGKTLTAPRIADLGFIADANGNELIIFDTVTSAVNEVTFANAATAGTPTFTASGGDTNISINFVAKGSGTIQVGGVPIVTTTATQTLTNKTLTTPIISSISNTGTLTLPTSTDTLIGRATTDTLTNKRITARVQSTTSTATLTFAADSDDIAILTAQAAALTIAAPSGTPTQGQPIVFRIKDNGTPRTITWNAIFRAIGITLPTTTVINKTMYVSGYYSTTDTKWDMVGYAIEA